jgi:hypothetical protein
MHTGIPGMALQQAEGQHWGRLLRHAGDEVAEV